MFLPLPPPCLDRYSSPPTGSTKRRLFVDASFDTPIQTPPPPHHHHPTTTVRTSQAIVTTTIPAGQTVVTMARPQLPLTTDRQSPYLCKE
ncbi:hypothetical protein J4Q44_G00090150 [Coregonus suidteri]|uniref:Uncharacterized protein n=1 Tax=Coregonus suidteri TaxID=861788 RepID=A0AAN8R201_9TELE